MQKTIEMKPDIGHAQQYNFHWDLNNFFTPGYYISSTTGLLSEEQINFYHLPFEIDSLTYREYDDNYEIPIFICVITYYKTVSSETAQQVFLLNQDNNPVIYFRQISKSGSSFNIQNWKKLSTIDLFYDRSRYEDNSLTFSNVRGIIYFPNTSNSEAWEIIFPVNKNLKRVTQINVISLTGMINLQLNPHETNGYSYRRLENGSSSYQWVDSSKYNVVAYKENNYSIRIRVIKKDSQNLQYRNSEGSETLEMKDVPIRAIAMAAGLNIELSFNYT